MSVDALFLRWTTSISPFGLIRKAMTERMVHHDNGHQDFVVLAEQLLRDRESDIDTLIELIPVIKDFELLLATYNSDTQ